jgi:hypothetical protein
MSIFFTLTDADRERIGCSERLEYDQSRVMVDEAEAIQDDAGIDPSEWIQAQRTWLDAVSKTFAALDSDRQRLALRAERAMIWIALHRAGIRVPLADVTYNRVGLRVDLPDTADGQGKDPSTPPDASPTGEPQ